MTEDSRSTRSRSDLGVCRCRSRTCLSATVSFWPGLQKAGSLLGCRKSACLPPSEPPIPSSGNGQVSRVAEWPRYDDEAVDERPEFSKPPYNSEYSRGADVGSPPFNQYHGISHVRVDLEPGQQSFANGRLQRSEAKYVLRVADNYKVDGAIAKVADAIKQDDGMLTPTVYQ